MQHHYLKSAFLGAMCLLSLSGAAQYDHSYSGTKFPARIAEFYYTGQRNYDESGKDISVSYSAQGKIELTSYVYPSKGVELDYHFNEYKLMLLQQKARAKVITSDTLYVQEKDGLASELTFKDYYHNEKQTLSSFLFMFKYKGWFVMVRATCPAGYGIQARSELKAYLENMPFPEIECK